MKRDELKKILAPFNPTDEAIDQIMKLHGDTVNVTKDVLNGNIADLQAQLAGRDKDIAELKKAVGDNADIQKKLSELQTKYDTDTANFKAQIEERDYNDAVRQHIADSKTVFSSKAAEKYFYAEAKAKKMKLDGGKLAGFESFLEEQRKADPTAFKDVPESKPEGKADTPTPAPFRFLDSAGNKTGEAADIGALMAAKFNADAGVGSAGADGTN